MTAVTSPTPTRTRRPPRPKLDATLAEAHTLAREAAQSIAEPGAVGEHLQCVVEGERVLTHLFECTAPAYRGWHWAVTVARVARSRKVTVSETHLLPGPDAVLAPAWVPYAQRLRPGDLGPADVLPYREADPLLQPGFEATGEEDVDQMAVFELGLGRARVLTAEGREEAAQRWYDGESGPTAETTNVAVAPCGSCGYYLPLAGALRRTFGVCANAWSASDGRVVSVDHGCGAHSETDAATSSPAQRPAPLLDEYEVELITTS